MLKVGQLKQKKKIELQQNIQNSYDFINQAVTKFKN